MPRMRVFRSSAPRRPQRVSRRRARGRLVCTPWAPDATGQPRVRLKARPWLPEYGDANGRPFLLGMYCPTFGCDWYMPADHELD